MGKNDINIFEKDWMWLESVSNKDYKYFFSLLYYKKYLNRIKNLMDANPSLQEQYQDRFLELIYIRIEEGSVNYNKRFNKNIDFLLNLVDQYDEYMLNCAIKNECFESFKRIVERYDNLIKLNKGNDIQNLLDTWLENLYDKYWENFKTDDSFYKKNKIFLLNCGAIKENALKLSVGNNHLKAFKEIIEENIDLQKIKQDINWVNDANIQKQLNIWLQYFLDIYYDGGYSEYIEEIIKILFQIGASKEIIYNKIKESIDAQDFYKFKFFIVNFKEEGFTIEALKQDDFWKNKLQNQLNAWLKEFSSKKDSSRFGYDYSIYDEIDKHISFLENCGAKKDVKPDKTDSLEKIEKVSSPLIEEIIKLNKINLDEKILDKEEMLKCSIDDDNLNSFKKLIKEGAKLEKVKKDITWNENKRVQNRLNYWLKEEREKKNEENIKFLLSLGAQDEDDVSNKPNISDDKHVQTEVKNNTEVDIQQSINENNTSTIEKNSNLSKDNLQENVSVEQQSIFQKILNFLKAIINFFKKYC